MCRHALLVAAVAAVAAAGCGGGKGDEGNPALAIARVRTGAPARYDIVRVHPGRRGLDVLAGRPGDVVIPALIGSGSWSPDGRRFVFSGRRRSRKGRDLYVVDANGGTPRRLTRLGDAVAPLWTASGRIVFTRVRIRPPRIDGALWSVGPGGEAAHRLTRSVAGRTEVATSYSARDGRLAITRSGKGGYAVYLARADGSQQRQFARDARDAAFSPDGARIAFVTTRDRNGSLSYGDQTIRAAELYVSSSDGRDRRRLTTTNGLNEDRPSWSPDGKRIAFQRGQAVGNAEGTSVWQMNADGTCARAILRDPRLDTWYFAPLWSPGGEGRAGRLSC